MAMTDPSHPPAGCPDVAARRLKIQTAAAAAVLCLVGLLTAVSAGPKSAGAIARHTVHRTVVRTAHASVTRAATVTAHATVGDRTASVTTTAHATGRASARATGRASASATRASVARRQAQYRAAARAMARANRAATERAAGRARTLATRMAHTQAAARANQAARTLAARDGSVTDPSTGTTETGTGATGTSTAGTGTASTGKGGGTKGGGSTGSTGGSTGGSTACGGETPVKSDGSAWTCTFDDEFDGTGLDSAKWVVQTTAKSGFAPGGGCYLDDPDTISVSGGALNLSVRKQSAPISCSSPKGAFSTSYIAGEVTTLGTFSQTYGRFEVRAQLPASTVAGLQETFWLWPNTQTIYGPWPASGEIDFAEFYSQYAGWVIPYLHYVFDTSTASWATNTNVVTAWPYPYNQPGMNCTIDQAGYNTYTFTWLPGRLTIAVNGQDCIVDNYSATNLASPAPFDQPFFLAFTQAIGVGSNAPTAATPFPATTRIDYVRAWK